MSATQRSVRVEVPNSGSSLQTLNDASAVPASMALILAAGGDRRIWPDPVTGRNRYGTRTTPASGEIVFSSTTARNVSVDGFAAADRALGRLIGTEIEPAIAYEQWFSESARASFRNLDGATPKSSWPHPKRMWRSLRFA